ncbi:Hsp70 family protein [Mycobacterium sp. CBMA293]|uniref:Hsp70 family protein n=1 Tax=unclassified Mycolicibacterium TaxID=2636767 RepID=UPI0012DC6D11|nr:MULTISPECIES: Hsp70 family protein [unclassified Mycolicibacterium]MUL47932.1 Hsp70 family protein [Mycolicibacterium sp. CBMA 360]MUL59220.1 Hsp70 family protein [Mycolicibacterium sp. CBMA 335]MUL70945.1 Hsp70 family protein [Mycolicibacterium sp. CBMA 311]MUL94588.1 Hsp70 family protein [Mycolicibacterium sp. CBMA 230]MUM09234.1 molecular chaperone [Mycolicibacterium sp. CBMA 213]
MSHQLGLSIGTTNLVAARVGEPPLVRRAVLSLFRDRAPQVGLPPEDRATAQNAVALSGFVERVGDPVPMVASDGTSYHADQLVVEALDALIEAAGGEPPTGQLAISVPAHWDTATLRAMRAAMRSNPSLAPNGIPARLVSDAVASLTALNANPGLPATGTAALLDFGGGGTSITLADAGSSYEPIETVRYTEFSGDHVDQALLAHVLDRVGGAGGVDTAGTAAVSSLEKLRESCCAAKEQLSEAETATVPVDIPGHQGAVDVTRAELSELLAEPLSGVFAELDDLLQRNKIAWTSISSIVAVGGGARMPMINARLADHLGAHGVGGALVTTPQPALDAAVGAALFAVYGADADAQTGMAPAALLGGTAPTVAVDGAPTAPAGVAELELPANTAADRAIKATGPSLAWSEDADGGGDLLPYTGEDPFSETTATRAIAQYVPPTGPVTTEPSKAWQRLPLVVFGIATLAAIAAVGGVTVALTGDRKPVAPPTTAAPSVSEAPTPTPVIPPPPPSTVTVTNEVPAPPPPPPPSPTYEPPVTHTPAPTHTVTTHAPTTTPPPVTTTPPPPVTTTPPTTPPPTTTETPTTTTPTMTTSYIRLPFVPVPIPIQVPNTETQSPANPYYPGQQYPQYPQQYPQYPQQYPYQPPQLQ